MSLRLLLRVARRDAARSRGRSLLVVAMVALPVLGLTAGDVLAWSVRLDPSERVERRLGATSAELRVVDPTGGPVLQLPGAGQWTSPPDAPTGTLPAATAWQRAAALLPPGSTASPTRSGSALLATRAGQAQSPVAEIDTRLPALRPLLLVRRGRLPLAAGEAAVSPQVLSRTGVRVGGTLRLLDPARELTVVGVATGYGPAYGLGITTLPGQVLPATTLPDRLLVTTPRPVSWAEVQRWSATGVVTYSRAVVLHPPADAAVPAYRLVGSGSTNRDVVTLAVGATLVVVLAALEVVLLAGAAFAVGARRQARALALVEAAGGEPRHVRGVVLAGGAVLGAVAGVLGSALGVATGSAVLAWMRRAEYGGVPGHVELRPLELAAIALLGVLTGVAAALLPARAAARQDVVAVLAGRRPLPPLRRRVPVTGLVLCVLGAVVAALGSALGLAVAHSSAAGGPRRYAAAGLIAGGAGLTELGLVLASGAVVALLGRVATRLPVAPRLALRDAARQRSRTAPAVAAVLTAVTGACAVVLVAASVQDRGRRSYVPDAPVGTALVQLRTYVDDGAGGTRELVHDPARVQDVLRQQLGATTSAVVGEVVDPRCRADGSDCRSVEVQRAPADRCPQEDGARQDPRDPRCAGGWAIAGGSLPVVATGDARAVAAITGRPSDATDPAVQRALADGGAVVFRRVGTGDPYLGKGGRLWVGVDRPDGSALGDAPVPAVVVPVTSTAPAALLGPRLVASLGMAGRPSQVLASGPQPPSAAQEDAARAALATAASPGYLEVERGWHGTLGYLLVALVLAAGLVVLGASWVTTGLAQADSRADSATLAAVGADPGVRRRVSAAQALAVSGTGTLLGVLAGFVPALAFVGQDESLRTVVPWAPLLVLLLGVPVVAALTSGLATRGRLQLQRRVA
ncbi:putative ABC transport system permease protein [Motilibacter rhizosphaerae]|uniref:Putative ABC transport system permease protein n=1 Tax=Motilibacter rhizosphaerae TaxID=598652 RepID=A0A4Q7NU69_9ACTN|nr:FtsX-like permease family protein [Motilibacter rhizosphaerae]RZS89952.1 putative ABC transport system permease protein [Motilibacter rhizosphaerae]